MRIRIRRRNFAWLGILAGMIGLGVLGFFASGVDAPGMIPIFVALGAVFGVAAVASVLEMQPESLIDRSRSSLTAMRMSADAREAAERARRRGGYVENALTLLDIGLITSQASREGMVMRRTRDVSKDDDGVRPFITLHVQPRAAEKSAVLRFEIIDQNGMQQYVHEMKTYLRDGEMNLLADHHLPLYQNDRIPSSGDWDLRVYLDGSLIGAHGFSVTPSTEERFARLEQRGAADSAGQARTNLSDERAIRTEDVPMSLEELLRSRGQSNSSQR
jgi:hypothetical protein